MVKLNSDGVKMVHFYKASSRHFDSNNRRLVSLRNQFRDEEKKSKQSELLQNMI